MIGGLFRGSPICWCQRRAPQEYSFYRQFNSIAMLRDGGECPIIPRRKVNIRASDSGTST